MHNWDYDLRTLDQSDEAERWKLERLILYGLGGEKISRRMLQKYWDHLRIPDDRRFFLQFCL